MRISLFLVLLLSNSFCFSNNEQALCKAVEKQNWKKVFKLIAREVNGTKLANGSYNIVFDSLISNFKSYDCIVDAEWSKCGAKILIYPGQETLAFQFNTSNGIVEKTLLLHTSKTISYIRVLGIRIRIPEIDKKGELDCLFMRDSENSSIEAMRKVCEWEVEEKRKRKHN
jgi:hypothetical protein